MFKEWLSRKLAAFLSKRVARYSVSTSTFQALSQTLQPGDVILIEGDAHISVAIQYLTQST